MNIVWGVIGAVYGGSIAIMLLTWGLGRISPAIRRSLFGDGNPR